MKKSLVLFLSAVVLFCVIPVRAFAAELSLDSIAWEQLTYRDIFIDNNLAYVNGFDSGDWGSFRQSAGSNATEKDRGPGRYSIPDTHICSIKLYLSRKINANK